MDKKYNDNDIEMMKLAIKLSETSTLSKLYGGPFGAVITKEGKVVGMAFNEVLSSKDPSAHGEVQAIRDATRNLQTYDLKGCKLYTSCEPCPMCLFTCKWAGIEEIYFAADRYDAEKIGFQDNHLYGYLKDNACFGIKIEECKDLALKAMLDWKEKYQDTIY